MLKNKILFKKVLSLFMVAIFMLTAIPLTGLSVIFANDYVRVRIDGQLITFSDQQPVIVEDRTLVPVRGVFEHMGYHVDWEPATRTVSLTNDRYAVIITLDSDTFTTNGVSYALEVPAQIINERTMLPFRAILESVGCEVDWDGGQRTVLVTTPDGREYTPAFRPNRENIVFADDVINLFNTSPEVLIHDGNRVSISADVFDTNVQPGDIIMLPPDLHYPAGRAVRVESAYLTGTQEGRAAAFVRGIWNLIVSEPNLEEVYSELDFRFSFVPDAREIVALSNERQAAGIGSVPAGFNPGTLLSPLYPTRGADIASIASIASIDMSNYTARMFANLNPAPTGLTVTMANEADGRLFFIVEGNFRDMLNVTGRLHLDFDVFEVDHSWFAALDDWYSIEANTEFTVETELIVDIQAEFAGMSIPLYMFPILTPIPGIMFWAELSLFVGLDGTVEIIVNYTAEVTTKLNWTFPDRGANEFNFNVVTSNHSMDLRLRVNGVLTARAAFTLKAGTISIVSLDGEAGVGAEVSIEMWFNEQGVLESCPNLHILVHPVLRGRASLPFTARIPGISEVRFEYVVFDRFSADERFVAFFHVIYTPGLNWNEFRAGQCPCLGEEDEPITTPILVPRRPGARIAAGGDHILAIKDDGTVWAWGSNSVGQLGDGTNITRDRPVQIPGLSNIVAVAAGGSHSMALGSDGTVWEWGRRYSPDNRLLLDSNIPVQVPIPAATAIATRGWLVFATTTDGTVWGWGANNHAILDYTDFTNYRNPAPVNIPVGGNATQIQAGSSGPLALVNGVIWTWPADGTIDISVIRYVDQWGRLPLQAPTQILDNVVYFRANMSGGSEHLALRGDGTVWLWRAGTRVDGVYIPDTPIQAQGLNNAVAVVTGGIDAGALLDDGTLWVWRTNNMTINNIPQREVTPLQIENLSNIVEISKNTNHFMVALRDDGTVWVLGNEAWWRPHLAIGERITDRIAIHQVIGPDGGWFNLNTN